LHRATLSDRRDFTDDGIPDHVNNQRQCHTDRRQRDLGGNARHIRHDRHCRAAERDAGAAEDPARHSARYPAGE
jgi:hypothetical protein